MPARDRGSDGDEAVDQPLLSRALHEHPVAMLAVDPATHRILDANAAAQRDFGWTRAGLLAMSLTDLRPAAAVRAMEQDTPFGSEARPAGGPWQVICADGRGREAEVVVSDLRVDGQWLLLVTAMPVTRPAQPAAPTAPAGLREHGEWLRLVMAAARIGTFRRDIVADRFELSPEARALHGLLPQGEVSLDTWFAVAPPEDRARVKDELAAGWARRAHEIALQYRLVDPRTGATRHIESRAVYTYDDTGRPMTATGVVIDITDHKRRELALVDSEERLRLAQEAAGIGVWEFDTSTGMAHFSPQSLRLHNLPADHPAVFPRDVWVRMIHPDDIAEAAQQRDRAIEHGTPFDYVFRVITGCGDVRWIQSRGRALANDAGQQHRILGAHIDVTVQVELAARLRRSEETHRLALEATDEGVWDWDIPSGRVHVSDRHCRMRGIEPHEADGSFNAWADNVHPDDLRQARARIDAHLRGEVASYASEYRIVRRDGTQAWILDRAKIVARDADGRPLRMVGTNQDISARVRLEAALTENERWLRLAQEAAGIGTFSVDLGSGMVRFSKRSRRLHGMPDDHPEVFPRSQWTNWVDAQDAAAASAAVDAHRSHDDPIELSFRIPQAGGQVRWVQALGRRIAAGGTAGDRFVGVHVDITERRELLDILRRNEDTLRLAIESADAGVWEIDIRTGLLKGSDRAAEILGETPAGFGSDVGGFVQRMHPEDRARYDATRAERLSGRVANFVTEYRVRHRDGRWVWVVNRGKAIDHDEQGRPRRLVGLLQDISPQKAIETALARSEAQLRSVIDAVPLGIVVVDALSEIRVVNPACIGMLGAASARELIGQPLHRFLDTEDGDPGMTQIEPGPGQQARLSEFTIRRPGRPALRVECVAVPFLLTEQGSGFLAVFTDVTRQRDAASQLRALEAQVMRGARLNAVGAMAAALAHQLNQPLTAASNYAQASKILLRQSDGGAGRVGEPLDLLDKSIGQMLRVGNIVRGLREFIGSDNHELATLRIADLLADVVAQIEAHHPHAAGARISASVEPTALAVFGDAILLEQVLTNLVRNALEACTHSARRDIDITARRHTDGQHVEIVVRDTGPGIPAALRRRLFDPVASSKPGGMGIGLAVSRAIMQLHGGSIRAAETEAGEGAEFCVLLPITGAALIHLQAEGEPPGVDEAAGGANRP
jgi:PAS domain S-box-containing protein